MQIILASASPQRQELLALAKIPFHAIVVEIDERPQSMESPKNYSTRIVNAKATAALQHPNVAELCVPLLLLTADTIGVFHGQILTKPQDKAHAFAMWQAMSGNTHEVWTMVQVALVYRQQILWQRQLLDKSTVTFVDLTLDDMHNYWATGEPCNKAGAYAIQGFGATWVAKISGNYSSIVGLPLPAVLALIQEGKSYCQRHFPTYDVNHPQTPTFPPNPAKA